MSWMCKGSMVRLLRTALAPAACCHSNAYPAQMNGGIYKIHVWTSRAVTMVTRSSSCSRSVSPDNASVNSEEISEEYLQWKARSQTPNFNMSFAGCGFLGMYHLGVAKALILNGQQFLSHVQRFGGASAGSLVAGILAIKGNSIETIDLCEDWVLETARVINKKPLGMLTPRFDLLASLEIFLDSLLPEDAHLAANEKLFVSLTTLEGKKNIILTHFESRDDVLKALMGSSYIPHITGTKPVKLHGKKYIDGGLTNNLPEVPDTSDIRTIFVSPFSGGYPISPYDRRGKNFVTKINGQHFQVNVDNLIRGYHAFNPPKPELIKKYFKRGMLDAIRFLRREGYYTQSDTTPPSSGISVDSAGESMSNETDSPLDLDSPEPVTAAALTDESRKPFELDNTTEESASNNNDAKSSNKCQNSEIYHIKPAESVEYVVGECEPAELSLKISYGCESPWEKESNCEEHSLNTSSISAEDGIVLYESAL